MAKSAHGQGVGTALLHGLIITSEDEAYWTLSAEIFALNTASRALHKKCGFREIGYRERPDQFNGVWHNVILLERRSQTVGGENLPTRKCDKASADAKE